MLFDLRARGRRRAIKVIYLSLAILMGGGLVLFGIGGDVSGGLVDAFRDDGGGGGSVDDRLERTEQAAVRRATANPKDPAAWAALVRARYQVAGAGDNFDSDQGAFTASGRRKLAQVEQAWDRYLALDPKPPDDGIASLVVQALGPAGLNKAEKAAVAQEIIAEARPSVNSYFTLAAFSYLAGQARKGDLAADKALDLAPDDERESLKSRLKELKENPTGSG